MVAREPSRKTELVVCDVGGLVDPDAVTIEVLARLQLTARRLGCRILLRHACGDLHDLITFMGLDDVVPCFGELSLEPGGQIEQREPPNRIQEEGDTGDPVV